MEGWPQRHRQDRDDPGGVAPDPIEPTRKGGRCGTRTRDRSGFLACGDSKRRSKAAEEIRKACEQIGFFTIVGHGVPDALVRNLKDEARAFFALPVETKNPIAQPPEKIARGYTYVGSRAFAYSIGKQTPPDLHETYAMGPIDEPPASVRGTAGERLFFMRNYWPEGRPAFRQAFESYYRAMEPLSLHILQLFARALG